MTNTKAKRERNQTFECLKLFAAVFIVYVHVGLPGRLGRLLDCLVRFSLPLFFSISGYYSYRVRSDKLIKRFWHILRLTVAAFSVQALWSCLYAALQGGSAAAALRDAIPSVQELGNLFFFHLDPMLGHLWYLAAIAAVYAVMVVYTRFYGEDEINYTPLYLASLMLFAIRYVNADLIHRAGVEVPGFFLRDGWFFGIPMFTMGLFIHQYQERLMTNYRLTTTRLLCLLAAGVGLSLFQRVIFGSSQLPLGAVVQAFALFMLALRHPRADFGFAPLGRLISTFGTLSTTVYILQFCVYDAYAAYFYSPVYALLGSLEPYVRPLLISLGGCLIGWLLCLGKGMLRRSKRA